MFEFKKEIWVVTKVKDGCVYKSKKVSEGWFTREEEDQFELEESKKDPLGSKSLVNPSAKTAEQLFTFSRIRKPETKKEK